MGLRCFVFCGLFSLLVWGQNGGIVSQTFFVFGKITDHQDQPLFQVKINILGQNYNVLSDEQGNFRIEIPRNLSSVDLVLSKDGFRQQTLPIKIPLEGDLILQNWRMQPEIDTTQELITIDLQDLQLMDDDFDRDQIGNMLHSQRNPFLNAAAFQFSSAFFRLRGLDSRHNTVTLNGIPMNAFDSGRPQWSQWGGLNDFTNRLQQFQYGITTTENHFGGLLGHTKIQLRPSALLKGSKISSAFSNATYQFRNMISHVGSIGKKDLFAFLFSYRGGRQGYIEGTPYQAFSGLLSFEKTWNHQHHSWMTILFTPSRRGKSSPLTQEVFDLKGKRYNPYWGWQNGKIRNARTVEVAFPMMFFNHLWRIKPGVDFQINMAYQWGEQSNSRINYNGHKSNGNFLIGGGQNPDPTYYQKLPSYFLRIPDRQNFQSAYLAQKSLIEDGQIDWNSFYEAHQNSKDESAVYALYEDVKAPKRGSVSFNFNKNWDSGLKLSLNGTYIHENSDFYARPIDLMGADHFWDFNPYASDFQSAQNDLNQPNRKAEVGDVFSYHYLINTHLTEFSGQLEYQKKGFTVFLGLKTHSTAYQRTGKYKNGSYPQNSWGQGKTYSFQAVNIKAGFNYAMTGKLRFFFNGGKYQLPPTLQNLFVNPRENHWINPRAGLENHWVGELGYQYQDNRLDFKLLVYWIQQKNLSEVSFYFADGVGGDRALFVQELLTGMQKDKKGLEFYGVYHPVPELKITAVAALGQFVMDNNPELLLSTVIDQETSRLGFEKGFKSMGASQLHGHKLPGGPQSVFSLGFDYEDPNYWRIGIFGNFFTQAYLDFNPLLRTQNFLLDKDGLPFSNYDSDHVQILLKQERFPAYFLLNATGGKSWRLGKKYLGFFVSLQNLLNTTYKTGGFQQGRNANYRSLLEDQSRPSPLFGPKYWWGRGTTYFTTVYLRF